MKIGLCLSLYLLATLLVSMNYTTDITEVSISSEEFIDFAPTKYKNGILFTSNRNSPHIFNLFYSEIINGENLSEPILIESKFNVFHVGPGDYCNATNEFYFSTSSEISSSSGINHLAVYKGKIENFRIIDIEYLFINNPEFEYTHPTISDDGKKLILSSNFGGEMNRELFEYERGNVNEEWQFKRKLDNLNSQTNELFPNFVNDSTLVFSSAEENGKGGLDLYSSNLINDYWTFPESIEHLNSGEDETGFIKLDSTSGFFSSSRSSKKDKLYYFKGIE